MSTKDLTIQQLMLNQVIYSKKAAIDQLMDGLCSLKFNELFQCFPLKFEPLLVSSSAHHNHPTPHKLIEMIDGPCSTDAEKMSSSMLKSYISSLNPEGISTCCASIVNHFNTCRMSAISMFLHWIQHNPTIGISTSRHYSKVSKC